MDEVLALPAFMNFPDYVDKAIEHRRSLDPDKRINLYIDCIDKVTKGIAPSDITLLVSDSGVGKTTLGSHVALNNAMAGKRGACFFLEGQFYEFAKTQLWKVMCDLYYREGYRESHHVKEFCYQNYHHNIDPSDGNMSALEAIAAERIKTGISDNLIIYERNQQLGIDNMQRTLDLIGTIEPAVQFVILDHLHFLDLLEREGYNEQYKKIMKMLQEFSGRFNIPVFVIAHINKEGGKGKVMPDIQDIMGSSDIYKIAMNAIIVAPDYDAYKPNSYIRPTLFKIVKWRAWPKNNLIYRKQFHALTMQYLPGWEVCKVGYVSTKKKMGIIRIEDV